MDLDEMRDKMRDVNDDVLDGVRGDARRVAENEAANSMDNEAENASQPSAQPEAQPGGRTQAQQNPQSGARNRTRNIVLLVCVAVALACGIYLVASGALGRLFGQSGDGATSASQTGTLPKNPVNFSALQQENPDIIGWITIPDTLVDYPVLQSPTDDFYYLTHNDQGETAEGGAIYMQMANSSTFSDAVTVLYGHNVSDNSMFTTLHYFENAEFFNEHEEMTVYTPGHILTYRIIAAYIYDDRHILNSFDFYDAATRTAYYESVLNPTSLVANVRADATLSADDKILQLSTCLDAVNWSNQRLIVTGVLVNDQATR